MARLLRVEMRSQPCSVVPVIVMTFNLEIAAESMRGGATSKKLLNDGVSI